MDDEERKKKLEAGKAKVKLLQMFFLHLLA